MTGSGPHLFGLAKVEDPDTLRQILGGWWPGMDDIQPQRVIAGVDVHGDGFVFDEYRGPIMEYSLASLAFPVHVIHAVTLPGHQVKPASEARPYRR